KRSLCSCALKFHTGSRESEGEYAGKGLGS
ncbi:MAG: hypothetical protein ACI835_003937, partial [Planctomycetota bacterium]